MTHWLLFHSPEGEEYTRGEKKGDVSPFTLNVYGMYTIFKRVQGFPVIRTTVGANNVHVQGKYASC